MSVVARRYHCIARWATRLFGADSPWSLLEEEAGRQRQGYGLSKLGGWSISSPPERERESHELPPSAPATTLLRLLLYSCYYSTPATTLLLLLLYSCYYSTPATTLLLLLLYSCYYSTPATTLLLLLLYSCYYSTPATTAKLNSNLAENLII